MNDSIFDNKRTAKLFAKLAKKTAKLQDETSRAVKTFMIETSPETLQDILKAIESNGHPYEQDTIRQLRIKYEGKQSLDFNDIVTLQNFYKSICNTLRNKVDDNG